MALPLLILAGVSTALSLRQAKVAGQALKDEADIAAKQAEVGVIQREADRKGRLIEALASQNAAAGAKGIAAFEGSPLTIMQEDIRREEVATERDKFSTDLGVMAKRFRASNQAAGLKTRAQLSLLTNLASAGGVG